MRAQRAELSRVTQCPYSVVSLVAVRMGSVLWTVATQSPWRLLSCQSVPVEPVTTAMVPSPLVGRVQSPPPSAIQAGLSLGQVVASSSENRLPAGVGLGDRGVHDVLTDSFLLWYPTRAVRLPLQ